MVEERWVLARRLRSSNALTKTGDGQLNETERARAREARRNRMEGGGPLMNAMREIFDFNEDGELDEKERAALREAMMGRRE